MIALALTLLLSVLAASGAQPPILDDKTALQVEALNRLKGSDLERNAALKSAVLKVLDKTRGTPQFVQIVRDFKLPGHADELLAYALKYPGESSGVEAFRLAVADGKALDSLLNSSDGAAVVRLMGNSNDQKFQPTLHALALDTGKDLALGKEAVRALAHQKEGATQLLNLEREGKLPAELRLTAASELNLAPWPEIKKAALEVLPLPQTKSEPLPPIAELVNRSGNLENGRKLFADPAIGCAACHQVNGAGVDFGPTLSEIGTKLGKDALYESILDPSSGIAFGFEGWNIELKNGDELFGLITSETADEIVVKAQTGISSRVPKSDIARRQKLSTSVMPAGLQLNMSTQDLVDLVEFLASLKKPEPD